jgi:H+/Cl- antiporter ClcA
VSDDHFKHDHNDHHDEPEVGMSAIGYTTVFPRKDNIYKHKESIPFDESQSEIWIQRPQDKFKESLVEWWVFLLIGVCVGTIAFLMKMMEEKLIDFAVSAMETQQNPEDIGTYKVFLGWMIYAGLSGIYGMVGGYLTTYHGQPAAGSGVAELIAYLNGVNYPGFLKGSTLLVKIFGVTLAVCGKLCVGKEGPLAHIGAIVGAIMVYIPWPDTRFLQNDEQKRIFIAAGSSAGVSVAFGAPIGGALFVYELSTPNTFWKFYMIWKVFFSCCVATFMMAMWNGINEGNFEDWSGADVKFGDLSDGL